MRDTLITLASDPAVAVLAAEPTLDPVKNLILRLLGTAIICLLAWRVTVAYAAKNYGEMGMAVAGALIVTWFVVTPDSAMATLGDIRAAVFPG